MIIEYAAKKIAETIKNADPDNTSSVEVLEYGALLKLNFWSVIIISGVIGFILKRPVEMGIAMSAFWCLRQSTGGYHFPNMTLCTIGTVLILTACTLVPIPNSGIIICNTVTLILVAAFGTKDLTAPDQLKPIYRLIAIFMVLANFILKSPEITLSFLAQAILLIKIRGVKLR